MSQDTELKARKEQLQKELNKIATIEKKALIEDHYPQLKKQYEGKFFKQRNSYSVGNSWWYYKKVIEIKSEDVYNIHTGPTAHCSVWTFQTTSNGQISIDTKERTYVHSLGEEISESEFNAAWNKMIDKLNSL